MLTLDKPKATPLPALSVAAQPPRLLDLKRAAAVMGQNMLERGKNGANVWLEVSTQ